MRKAISTLVASLMLCGALAMAQPAASKTDKDKNKDSQHHSKLSKVKFWNHNKDGKKNAAKATQTKTASVKPAQAKSTQAKSEKQANKDQKQQIAHNMKPAKPGVKKSTASHAKSSHKSQEPKEKPPLKQ